MKNIYITEGDPTGISYEIFDSAFPVIKKKSNKYTFIFVSSQNKINPKYSKNFEIMVKKLHELGIFVVAYIINGLPYETKEDMLNTIRFLNSLDIDAVKIHMLHILKDTKLASMYEKQNFHILTKKEYKMLLVSLKIKPDDLDYLIEKHFDFIKEELSFLVKLYKQ